MSEGAANERTVRELIAERALTRAWEGRVREIGREWISFRDERVEFLRGRGDRTELRRLRQEVFNEFVLQKLAALMVIVEGGGV